jgi:ABC-type multidrug transport system fused ATPase/permease subunit
MNSNQSDLNRLSTYKLYFDDIEELFLNTISFKYIVISTILTCLITIINVILLLYRSRTLFLACLIPFIYTLIFYDCLQLLSINLLKINLLNLNEKFFSELCRWPYYFKALSEAGQCLTLIFLYAIRCQKVQYFLKHKYLLNSSHIHSRALTFVCLLFIVYANNWITHLKIEKIHLITIDELKYEINIQEYPMPLYGVNDVKLNDREQFYLDFNKYAQNYEKNQSKQSQSEKIIHNQKGGTVHEIIIKIPYNNFFAQPQPIQVNRTRQKSKKKSKLLLNKTIETKHSYRIHRCTYGQRNFILTNLWFLIHSIFYLVLIIYFLTTIYRYKIPSMTVDYHQKLHDHALSIGRRKSADCHKQLMLLTHLRQFQYFIVYCYTTFILIRLIYVCLLTIILFLSHSPFHWLPLKIFFYVLFLIIYYSIPIRLTLLFLYLFLSLFSSYIYSIFYYIFHTKLHFSCQLQKPNIRFHLHIVPYNQHNIPQDEHSTNSLVLDLTSSIYEEHSTMIPTESIAINEENSSSQNVITTNSFLLVNEFEHTKL